METQNMCPPSNAGSEPFQVYLQIYFDVLEKNKHKE